MTAEGYYRWAFLFLLAGLFAMRAYFMIKVHRSGGQVMPDEQAIKREGGRGFFFFRLATFFALLAFLGMYIAGMEWMDIFMF
jgi:hypothetical protein